MWSYIAVVRDGKKVCGLSLVEIPRKGDYIDLSELLPTDAPWPFFNVDTVIHNPSNKALKNLGFSLDAQQFNAIIYIS